MINIKKYKIIAPVALFVYNRPAHTKRTLESLLQNVLISDTVLYIFSDGPKSGATSEEIYNIEQVRQIISNVEIAKEKFIFESKHNMGLAYSIIHGINRVFQEHERIIVIEDDLILQPGCLSFLNDSLEIYKNDPKVMHIGAYMHRLHGYLPETAMTRLMTCWGWATWRGSWSKFNPNPNELLAKIENKYRFEFDFGGSYNFYRMLKRNAAGKNDSWAVRWYASIFIENGLCYNTIKSLVENAGHDQTGTHSYKSRSHKVNKIDYVTATRLPMEENKLVRRAIIRFFWKLKIWEIPNYIRYKISGK